MKPTFLLFALMATFSLSAQDLRLPAPNPNAPSASVVEALRTRHSVRSFASEALSLQQISDLCWAACGTVRGGGFRTAPTARNKQEIRLYVFTQEGAFEYMAEENRLALKAKGDHRALVAGTSGFSQDFVMEAPLSLVMVIDFAKFGSQNQQALMMGCVDAGNVSQNVNLYCQAVGLATVPRATMDVEGLRKLLGLTEQQLPVMNNPVGWERK